ncbi:MAG: 1-(5-phosphoribosyl)-5-[(5-phosphoribosylamino)methylideneamino]imidazole-4-carboxamide isomerase [Flavobacteriaceae bacterium]|jgi:phosphoribosylformimino-5-aminoimidazole carboxamide ribotide isomerase|nr:1-(5-phosphoribosyl)-5-[(5-phosphoribosylamino)methylideneamino]imidazole-4-carboxamide isomerase [Flavobacteriaceae bacterium]
MKIIPAIDLIDGQCVRLTKGDYSTKKVYNTNPLEVAKQFEDVGIEFLHLVDLDGAKAQHIVNYKVLEEISVKTQLKIDFGGGLKSDEDLKIAFESGANQITGGSIAVKNPSKFESWLSLYGAKKIILGADCMQEKIAVHGWQEESDLDVLPFIDTYVKKGITDVICTDISKDGMLQGPSYDLYREILNNTTTVNLIASGGVSSAEDLPKLAQLGCSGVIIGKAIYEGKITLKQLESIQLNSE